MPHIALSSSLSVWNANAMLEVEHPFCDYELTVMKKKATWLRQKKEGAWVPTLDFLLLDSFYV